MIVPASFHAASDDLPWADDWAGDPGIKLKLLIADNEGARFAVRMLFEPGLQVFEHKHTGEVHAFTLAGEWYYLEYPDSPPNTKGSYLFEPPGSTSSPVPESSRCTAIRADMRPRRGAVRMPTTESAVNRMSSPVCWAICFSASDSGTAGSAISNWRSVSARAGAETRIMPAKARAAPRAREDEKFLERARDLPGGETGCG